MAANRKHVLIAAITTLVLIGVTSGLVVDQMKAAETNDDRMIQGRVESFPLTIAVTWHGPDAFPRRLPMWFLSINSAGLGELTSKFDAEDKQISFKVPQNALAKFRATLRKEDFFGLKAEYGDLRIHGATVHVTVVAGEFTKSVEIRDFDRFIDDGDAKHIKEGARAVRCLIEAAGLYDDKLSTSLRNDFKRLLQSVKEH